jgi:hypothetical protein
MCYGGTPHERLLSESSRSYMLVFRMYAISLWSKSPTEYLSKFYVYLCFICSNTGTVDKLQAVSFLTLLLWLFPTSLKVTKTVQTITFYVQDITLKDMLTCMKNLARLKNAHEECRRNTLKPA